MRSGLYNKNSQQLKPESLRLKPIILHTHKDSMFPAQLNLSAHFTLAEATRSAKAETLNILNIAPTSVIATMRQTAMEMEVVRATLGFPLTVNSWFRCAALNHAVGSKDTSQHRVGEAVDFICTQFGTPLDICRTIIKHQDQIPFDQLILEHSWVHISFSILNGKPRGQVLSLLSSGGYALGLTDPKGTPYK